MSKTFAIFNSDSVLHLKGHLGREDELVTLEEASRRVLVHAVRDAVGEVLHAGVDLRRLLRPLDRHVEDHAEGLQRELVDGIDLVQVVQDEV